MRRLIVLIIYTAMAISGTNALASDQRVGIAEGFGATTCGQFAQLYGTNPEATETAYFNWAEGYMTSLNTTAAGEKKWFRNFAVISIDDQKAYIRKYCDAHPLAFYAAAVIDLWGTLPVTDY